MRLCRFLYDDVLLLGFYHDHKVIPLAQAAEHFSEIEGREILLPASDDLLDLLPPLGEGFAVARSLSHWLVQQDDATIQKLSIPTENLELLVPLPAPGKLLLLAGNYAKHIQERGGQSAEREETFPYVFMKPPTTTLTHPHKPVLIPKISPDKIDWECELAVIIGRECRNVEEDEALKYVAGYSIINDISNRGFRPNPGRKTRERDKFFDWLHGKWHNTFCPMGPCITSSDSIPDPQTLQLSLEVNGVVKQNASTGQMIFPVAAIVSFLSNMMTLEPGDIIATGTPEGTGDASGTYLAPGDRVCAIIEGIGELENPIQAEKSPADHLGNGKSVRNGNLGS